MGNFLAGFLGSVGDRIQQQELRSYDEKIKARQQKMDILKAAAQNAKPEALPEIFKQMGELADEGSGKKGKGGGENAQKFGMLGNLLSILHKGKQAQQPQAQPGQPPPGPGTSSGRPWDEKVPIGPGGLNTSGPGAPPVINVGGGQPAQVVPPVPGVQSAQAQVPALPARRPGFNPQAGWFETDEEKANRERAAKLRTNLAEAQQKNELREEDITSGLQLVNKLAMPKDQGGQGLSREDAEFFVFKHLPTIKQGTFNIPGKGLPEQDAQGNPLLDAFNQPINRGEGSFYRMDSTGKLTPAVAGGGGGKGDPQAKLKALAEEYLAANPNLTRDQAVQMAGATLVRNADILPQQRLALQANAMQSFIGTGPGGQSQVVQIPRHPGGVPRVGSPGVPQVPPVPGAGSGGPTPPPRPAARAGGAQVPPVPGAGGGQSVSAGPGGSRVTTLPSGFSPGNLGNTDRAVSQGAEGAIETATDAANRLEELVRNKDPRLGKSLRGGASWLESKTGMLPEDLGPIDNDIHSTAAFLMGIHRARGKGYADSWAQSLGNPWVNPEGTIANLRHVSKIAQKIDQRAKERGNKFVTPDDIKAMDKEGVFNDFDAPPPGMKAAKKSSGAEKSSGGKIKVAPVPGTVDEGYRFKGGDPNDEKNWEKVQ